MISRAVFVFPGSPAEVTNITPATRNIIPATLMPTGIKKLLTIALIKSSKLPYFNGLQICPVGQSTAKTVETEPSKNTPIKNVWQISFFMFIFYQKCPIKDKRRKLPYPQGQAASLSRLGWLG